MDGRRGGRFRRRTIPSIPATGEPFHQTAQADRIDPCFPIRFFHPFSRFSNGFVQFFRVPSELADCPSSCRYSLDHGRSGPCKVNHNSSIIAPSRSPAIGRRGEGIGILPILTHIPEVWRLSISTSTAAHTMRPQSTNNLRRTDVTNRCRDILEESNRIGFRIPQSPARNSRPADTTNHLIGRAPQNAIQDILEPITHFF
jgi:hypothetical protein